MDVLANSEVLRFEGFRLERRGLFWRDEHGVLVPVAIGSRALDLLRVLMPPAAISSRRTRSWLPSGPGP